MAGFGETWKLDSNGDVIYDERTQRLVTISGPDTLAQDVLYRLRTTQGEDPISPQLGLPVIEMIAAGYNPSAIEGHIRQQLELEKRISLVNSVEVGPMTRERKVTISVTCTSVEGATFSVSAILNAQ